MLLSVAAARKWRAIGTHRRAIGGRHWAASGTIDGDLACRDYRATDLAGDVAKPAGRMRQHDRVGAPTDFLEHVEILHQQHHNHRLLGAGTSPPNRVDRARSR